MHVVKSIYNITILVDVKKTKNQKKKKQLRSAPRSYALCLLWCSGSPRENIPLPSEPYEPWEEKFRSGGTTE